MDRLTASLATALLGALAAVALGQDEAPEPRAPEAPEAEESEPAPERPEASDDVFIPSEELQADEEVTFPVDI